MPPASAGLIVHGGRLVDVDGESGDAWLLAEGDTISAVGLGDSWRAELASRPDAVVVDAGDCWVAPGFIDVHVHGGGGHSFDEGGAAADAALALHRRHGTTRSLISLVSSPLARVHSLLADVADLCARDPLVLGAHLEGPYLAAARRGAHNAEALRTPDPDEVERMLEVSAGALRQITVAPELPGTMAAISRLVEAGVTVAVGHTEADYAQARAAFEAGASSLTHAFNAMAPIDHRAPGPVVAAIDHSGVCLEVINDGVHVAPSVVRLLFAAAPGRVVLVTDAMAAAGAGDGAYHLGARDVVVHEGVARLADDGALAGSTLTQDAALRHALALGLEPADAVAAVTSTPARVLGLDDRLGRLRPGYAADLVILDATWRVTDVYAAGLPLSSA